MHGNYFRIPTALCHLTAVLLSLLVVEWHVGTLQFCDGILCCIPVDCLLVCVWFMIDFV